MCNMSSKVLLLIKGLVLILLLMGCGNERESGTIDSNDLDELTYEESIPEVVAVVNGEEIKKDVFTSYFEQMKMNYEMQGYNFEEDEESIQVIQVIEEQVMNQLVSQTLLLQSAKNYGFNASEEEINNYLADIIAQFGSEEEFNEILEIEQLSISELKEQITAQIILDNYIADVTTSLSVTQEELEENYEEMKSMFGDELPAFEEFKAELEQQILRQKADEHLDEVINTIKESSEIEILI